MLRVLDVKFRKFTEEFSLDQNAERENWKRFVNYHFFSQFQPGRLDTDAELLDQICVDSPEYSELHGAMFFLNGQVLSEPQDVNDILQKDRKGEFELLFLSLGSERLDVFLDQLNQILCAPDSVKSDEMWADIFRYIMSPDIVLKWKKNPQLSIICYGEERLVSKKIEKAKKAFSGLNPENYSEITGISLNDKKLEEIINSNENSYCAEVSISQTQGMINISDIDKVGNAYVVSMSAKALVEMLMTSDGLFRYNMFDDNVRDYQERTAVNGEIETTLRRQPDLFVLFNNGITIVCDEVRPDHDKYILENPQVVNGCQTCNVVYRAYKKGITIDKARVIVKIVSSGDPNVLQGIVRGANRQNIVYEEAFETIREFHKKLERYFELNEEKGFFRIYYERRSRQYANQVQVKAFQKISFRGLIQSMVALFLNQVENSHRHEYKLLQDYKENLFIDTHSEAPYYLAALLYTHVDKLFRERILPKDLSSFKMHIMLLMKEMRGGVSPGLSSKEIGSYCDRLIREIGAAGVEACAKEACKKFREIQDKWIQYKGASYRFGMKDSAEFRSFLMKEVHGAAEEEQGADKQYTGYVLSVSLDKNNTLYGFIERTPDNIFFHEFDNPNMDRSYIGKKVTYKIVRNGTLERAIHVQII